MNFLFIEMEYCKGLSLDFYLSQNNSKFSMNEKMIYQIFIKILDGLIYLDSKNIIHNDLCPRNILVQDKCLKIADFGMAMEVHEEKSNIRHRAKGFYQAPEIEEGFTEKKSDVFSLGMILFELVA